MTDLSGWQVGVEEFLGVVLESVAQPVWVVDHHGLIRYANPAAVTALGGRSIGIVSEALANAVKHAHASQVAVSLLHGPDAVMIDVADDGIGRVTLDSASGTGLGGLADRIAALSGVFVVTSPRSRLSLIPGE
jgi:signal transduction histidine kinase